MGLGSAIAGDRRTPPACAGEATANALARAEAGNSAAQAEPLAGSVPGRSGAEEGHGAGAPTGLAPTARSAGAAITVDVGAIRRNYAALSAALKPGARCAAVVKADAYGLGASHIAPALAAVGCRHFFVAHLDEAAALKPHLPAPAELFVLNGLMPGAEADCRAVGAVPVLNDLDQMARWQAVARADGTRLDAIVQIDTGMSRLGLSPAELERLASEPERFDGLNVRYVMSHLACADEPNHPANRAQLDAFNVRRRLLPAAPASFANSAGIFLGSEFHFDLARPGIALYGVNPSPDMPLPVEPVLRLEARVVQVREVDAGAGVGYGHSFMAPRRMRVATISVGYADGWIRLLGNRGSGRIGETPVPFIGRISMDSATLDVSDVPGEIADGTAVELIGPHRAVEVVAADAGTIGYEVLTGLGGRYHRRYIGL